MHEQLTGLIKQLVDNGYLSETTAEKSLETANKFDMGLTFYLTQNNIVSSDNIFTCAKQNYDIHQYNSNSIDDNLKSLLPIELLKRHRVYPLTIDEHALQLAITDPTNYTAIAAISFHTGLRILPILISENELENKLRESTNTTSINSHLEQTLSQVEISDDSFDHISMTENDEPIAYAVNQLIQDAIQKHASDIHIEPYANHHRIRFRCDGLLQEIAIIPTQLALRICTRIKLLANLNIAERRLPQDGRLLFSREKNLDIRLNLFPTLHGEKIVMRLNDTSHTHLNLKSLGLLPTQMQLIEHHLHQPQGLIIVSGPTGSGKTATLYTFIKYLNSIEKNITTAEDPIEIELQGINQLMINLKIGLSFNTTLRAMLRQDPDILMIGEIRDFDSATIALQAAQTGHLVLSSIHANYASETTTRLHTLGIDIPRITQTLSLTIAQRLLRKLCEHCKSVIKLSANHPLATHLTHTYAATGCQHCHQGYRGRTGIFEITTSTQPTINLWDAAIAKIRDGITSFDEALRVLGVLPTS